MYEILKDFQVLIASIFALGAAYVGFRGVVYAQKKAMENAEAERKHREEMAQLEIREETDRLRMTMLVAISAELSTFEAQMGAALTFVQQAQENQELSQVYGTHMFGEWETPIFDACLDKIGALPHSLAHGILCRYHFIKSLKRRIPNMNPKNLSRMEKLLADQIAESEDLNFRIHAVRLGHPDPGFKKGADFWADLGKAEQLDGDSLECS